MGNCQIRFELVQIKYDFLVVATGLRLGYEQIQGLSN